MRRTSNIENQQARKGLSRDHPDRQIFQGKSYYRAVDAMSLTLADPEWRNELFERCDFQRSTVDRRTSAATFEEAKGFLIPGR
jgi:hypothetical protein